MFEKLNPTQLFFRCVIPSMVTMAFSAVYMIADGLFVGRFIGGDALAAVNLTMPAIMIAFAFSSMIATGASVRISVLLGEKNQKDASAVFSFTIKAILLLSCVIGLLGFFLAEPFIRLLAPGATEQAIEYGITYIRMYAAFAPLVLLFFATDNFLRVCGRQQLSMWLNIGSQALNIILNIVFVIFLGQGVWAVAFTSCFSLTLGSVISLWLFRGNRLDIHYTRKNISLSAFGRLLANGSSEFFSSISMSVMSIVYNLFLLKYGGTTAVAAFSVIMYVDSIVGMLIFGMCDALQPAISYCYGAGLMKKVRAVFKRMILGAVILSITSMLFMFFLGPYVAPLFIKPGDTQLLAVSITGMKIFAFSYLTGWVDMCFSSYFTALERPGRSLIVSLFGTLAAPVAFLFILTPIWQLNGVWLTASAACTASAILTIILAVTMKHKKAESQ